MGSDIIVLWNVYSYQCYVWSNNVLNRKKLSLVQNNNIMERASINNFFFCSQILMKLCFDDIVAKKNDVCNMFNKYARISIKNAAKN